jgi:alcohol dehydrogenase (cytochrome c)
VVVLDARTGALKWWYQLDPNDSHDLDLAAAPVLYANGAGRDVVAAAGKDGYVHVVDRLTHRLLFKTATTTIENEGVKPSARTTKFCPGGLGGTSFNGPALDPRQRMLFVASVDWCNWVTHRAQNRFIRTAAAHARPGDEYTTIKMATDPSPSGWLVALDSDTGVVKWKYHATAPIVAGVTATAGGIVMTGDTAGNFLVLDSATGRVLYKMKTQGGLAGGVVTYAVGGRQYVAFTSGNISRSSLGAPDTVGVPTLMVLALNPRSR